MRKQVEIVSTVRRHALDVGAVDAAEVNEANVDLPRMNFDERFKVENVWHGARHRHGVVVSIFIETLGAGRRRAAQARRAQPRLSVAHE